MSVFTNVFLSKAKIYQIVHYCCNILPVLLLCKFVVTRRVHFAAEFVCDAGFFGWGFIVVYEICV